MKPEMETVLWNTPLDMAFALEMVMLEVFLSWPLELDHVVTTVSLLLATAGRVTVQESTTMRSLRKRPVLTVTSTLGGGTAWHSNKSIHTCNS